MQPDIHRLLELQQLLLLFSQTERQTHRQHNDSMILENDSEHSYNLAMTGWYLSRWFPKLDKNLIIQYALLHDLVEVHAGDTYLYGSKEELASKKDREAEALLRLEEDWSDFEDLPKMIHVYESRKDDESKFIYALDKIMPIMTIYIHDGYSWQKGGITATQLFEAKIDKVNVSPEIRPYFDQLYQLLLDHPEIIQAS